MDVVVFLLGFVIGFIVAHFWIGALFDDYEIDYDIIPTLLIIAWGCWFFILIVS